jgi:hypothetical protein
MLDQSNRLPMSSRSLSMALLAVTTPAFFNPLADQRTAPALIDCIDRLDRESGASAGELSRGDALQLIAETIAEHREVNWAQADGQVESALADAKAKANHVFNRLYAARWIDERNLGIDDRRVVVEPTVRWLLDAFRRMSSLGSAEVHSFADTLRGVCEALTTPDAFDPRHRSADEMFSRLSDLSRRAETATNQLNHVYLILRQFIERQGQAATGRDNLRIFFDEFGAGQHQVCYDELFAKGLVNRLDDARRAVEDMRWNYGIKQHLASAVAARSRADEGEAREQVNALLDQLAETLGGITAMAQQIDGRVSHFHRISYERFSYVNDRSGRHADLIKRVFDLVDRRAEGCGFATLPQLELPRPLVPELESFHGVESLLFPRQRREQVKMFGGVRTLHADDNQALERLRRRFNESLSPLRAGKFVRHRLPNPGDRCTTNEFRSPTEDDLFDLLAAVLHQRYGPLRWQVIPASRVSPWHPEKVPIDEHNGLGLERFTLKRIT